MPASLPDKMPRSFRPTSNLPNARSGTRFALFSAGPSSVSLLQYPYTSSTCLVFSYLAHNRRLADGIRHSMISASCACYGLFKRTLWQQRLWALLCATSHLALS